MCQPYDSDSKLDQIVQLTKKLIRFGAVSTGERINFEGIYQEFIFLSRLLRDAGLRVMEFCEGGRFPALYCDVGPADGPPIGDILFAGHFDVVPPQSPVQLDPVVDGDWLRGRGSADMLAVVATLATFMSDLCRDHSAHQAPPRLGLLLVGNEEPGDTERWGTPYVLDELRKRYDYQPSTLIAGERTGEGATPHGLVEVRNRGLVRLALRAGGEVGHTALARMTATAKLMELYNHLAPIARPQEDFWRTTFQVSYFFAGAENNFNTSAKEALAGFELRPATTEDFEAVRAVLDSKVSELGLSAEIVNFENMVEVDPRDPRITMILDAAEKATGVHREDLLGKGKLPATQARFAPEGCAAVVWGQSGVGPHAENEAHYLPSVLPYYDALWHLAEKSRKA